MSTVIQIENLWKEYRLGVIGHGTLTRDLQAWWAKVTKKEDPNSKVTKFGRQEKQIEGDRFSALRGVELKVEQGEILGIIGKNGAGKSTLLKILSRVTGPTHGSIKIKGRVASLLEVGTGFHPELTGRENIYLNGAILGMSKFEINSQLEEIIDFSGVEEFIDTPVKRYSSGMYVRLAFAVSAHLESEILIVDEVLAVGDMDFQKKCQGKMGEISRQGRTILFVSHNMGAVERLCSRGLMLENGEVVYEDEKIDNVISKYLGFDQGAANYRVSWMDKGNDYYHPNFTPKKVWLTLNNEVVKGMPLPNNKNVCVQIAFNVDIVEKNLLIGIRVYEEETRLLVFVSQHTDNSSSEWPRIEKGLNVVSVEIPRHLLNEGKYVVELSCNLHKREWILRPQKHDIFVNVIIMGGLSESPYWYSRRGGSVAPVLKWKAEETEVDLS